MDIDQLHAFCQLAHDRNYRVASEHLCVTQSALTKKIKRLEKQLKVVLFERGRHGAELTQVGQILLPEAWRMIRNFESFQTLSNFVAEGTYGHLDIAFGISTYHEAPRYIAMFKQLCPDVHVTLNDMPSHNQIDELLSGNIQLGFDRLPIESPLASFPLFSDQLAIAVNCSDIIDEQNLWSSLQQLNYLGLSRSKNPTINRQIDTYFLEVQQKPHLVQETDHILTLLALVSARLGYAIVPASAARISQAQIRFIPLSGLNVKWDVGLLWDIERPNPIRDKFIQEVKNNTSALVLGGVDIRE
ncbi:LysR family transcriptional regulator [Vibrio sp. VB16]|uniref:LysR family transcriptional regulator n=1 Tax=Vibrio sp. VB16 TaxID=2785746 RepID=UPI00189C7B08|nr:LysR family transcriptional regulator [Vibrio sp. VB16]UGA54861.1 LysR family transcriptional regulator [Vibrio sp. VB16]